MRRLGTRRAPPACIDAAWISDLVRIEQAFQTRTKSNRRGYGGVSCESAGFTEERDSHEASDQSIYSPLPVTNEDFLLLDRVFLLMDGVYFLLDAAPDARRDETRTISSPGGGPLLGRDFVKSLGVKSLDPPPRRSSKKCWSFSSCSSTPAPEPPSHLKKQG